VLELDLRGSKIIRWFFRLRGAPLLFDPKWLFNLKKLRTGGLGLTLQELLKSGFVNLATKPNEELLLGLIGQFWRPGGEIQRVDIDEFRNFRTPGFAKAVWNFSLSKVSDDWTVLSTETRIQCLDDNSRKKFKRYWSVIQPFSGLIRKEALRIIKKQAEKSYF